MRETLTMEAAPATENLRLPLTRVIEGDRQRVFNAWTRPEMMRQWFGPGKMAVSSISSDLQPGGDYRIQMEGSPAYDTKPEVASQNRVAVATGAYKQIISPELLSFTWRGDWAKDEETLITIRFREVEEGTEVTLTQERFATTESREAHLNGWTNSLDKLEAFVEN